ncbi:unnamed protein product [Fusarium graminearum]|uniref:Chromosome 2, complete genome n=1 Tax=Gibberella zeae (strain ATCC MYA-4620 / CBS 123657 / FGSC 9075 / NRRL 31084 / PH-1) TaxID=229533 RepID=A0A0E0S7B4_GIBZE|nr:hypothetical protein FG05_30449 [Fusarium graminearum]CEF79389.1 unnamed protein product [Fusarium graminearum]
MTQPYSLEANLQLEQNVFIHAVLNYFPLTGFMAVHGYSKMSPVTNNESFVGPKVKQGAWNTQHLKRYAMFAK